MIAPIARLPAITIPMVAAMPIRGGATVTVRMMKRLSAPPIHSHGGSRRTRPIPSALLSTTARAAAAMSTVTRPEKATAAAIPTRFPSSPITAAWTAPARPAPTASATAPDTRLLPRHRRRLVALEEAEGVALGILARREPADARDRLLVLG